MKSLITQFFLSLIMLGCGSEKEQIQSFQVENTEYLKFVNTKSLPKSTNLTLEKNFVNNEYPIEIALYNDQKWYYNLPNLGEGVGTYKIRDGKVILIAQRSLFDMYIEMRASDSEAKNVHLFFRDRHGPHTLPLKQINMPSAK